MLEHPCKINDDAVVAFEEVCDALTGSSNVSAEQIDDDDDDGYDDGDAENSERPQRRRRYAVCDKPVQVSPSHRLAQPGRCKRWHAAALLEAVA